MAIKDDGWVYILPDATLCYKQNHIDVFVNMWKEGQPISAISEWLNVKMFEVALLVMHCELEGLIDTRPGGLLGTKEHKWKKRR